MSWLENRHAQNSAGLSPHGRQHPESFQTPKTAQSSSQYQQEHSRCCILHRDSASLVCQISDRECPSPVSQENQTGQGSSSTAFLWHQMRPQRLLLLSLPFSGRRAQSPAGPKCPSLTQAGSSPLTLALLLLLQELPQPVRRDGKGDARCHLHGVHTNHLPILQGKGTGIPSLDHCREQGNYCTSLGSCLCPPLPGCCGWAGPRGSVYGMSPCSPWLCPASTSQTSSPSEPHQLQLPQLLHRVLMPGLGLLSLLPAPTSTPTEGHRAHSTSLPRPARGQAAGLTRLTRGPPEFPNCSRGERV